MKVWLHDKIGIYEDIIPILNPLEILCRTQEEKVVLKRDIQKHQNIIKELYFINKTADLLKIVLFAVPEGIDVELILE